jgi:hypothetical protein
LKKNTTIKLYFPFVCDLASPSHVLVPIAYYIKDIKNPIINVESNQIPMDPIVIQLSDNPSSRSQDKQAIINERPIPLWQARRSFNKLLIPLWRRFELLNPCH